MSEYREEYKEANRNLWDERASLHLDSGYYDLAGFKAGKSSLKAIELAELGPVRGKSLLHLQCHFGMDTLSWAREGAIVTGLDFSTKSVEQARSLSQELAIPARFVWSDVYEAGQKLAGEQFEIVFTSYGVLCWLPDLTGWAKVIAGLLKPGGLFYMVEHHPFALVMAEKDGGPGLEASYPYFHNPVPLETLNPVSYAGTAEQNTQPVEYEWRHSLGEIITALCEAGLKLEFLHEFPYCDFRLFSTMVQDAAGWWRLPDQSDNLPLMFSLKAVLPN